MHTLTHLRWRSVRIFARNPAPVWQWSLILLGTYVKAFAAKFPDAPFFATRYVSEDGVGDGKDPANFPLPADCLVQDQDGKILHLSMRFRFVSGGPEETFVLGLLAANAAHVAPEVIEDYNSMEFGEHRGFAAFDQALPADPVRAERANLMGHLLWWNSRLVVHALQQNAAGVWAFEVNGHNRVPLQSSLWLPLHLTKNIYGTSDGTPFNCYFASRPLTPAELNGIPGVALQLV